MHSSEYQPPSTGCNSQPPLTEFPRLAKAPLSLWHGVFTAGHTSRFDWRSRAGWGSGLTSMTASTVGFCYVIHSRPPQFGGQPVLHLDNPRMPLVS